MEKKIQSGKEIFGYGNVSKRKNNEEIENIFRYFFLVIG